jgi:gas vesicle protein
MEVKMSSSKTQLAGFLVAGAALGAFVTLLFAPKSGAQTRKDIRRFSKKTAKQIDELKQDVRDQVSGGIDGVMDVIGNGKEYINDGKKGLQKLIKNVR